MNPCGSRAPASATIAAAPSRPIATPALRRGQPAGGEAPPRGFLATGFFGAVFLAAGFFAAGLAGAFFAAGFLAVGFRGAGFAA